MKQTFASMPKIDLHCHLDGSLSRDFLMRTLHLDTLEPEKIQAPADCQSLAQYLTCFDLPVRALQEDSHIRAAIVDVVQQAAKENIRYMEIRFAPALCANDHLDLYAVVQAAIYGCKMAFDKYGVFTNLILCAMRHHSLQQNLLVARCAREFLHNGVCALDLAGDEAGHPNEEFVTLFEEANRLGLPFTIHSGECGSIQNVALALEFGARRIGHGIAAIKDPALLAACQKAHIGFELCPTSNFQTKAVTDKQNYPLRAFLDNSILATINTDNRTVSNTTLTNEFSFACSELQIKKEDLHTLYRNSVEISFASDSVKQQLIDLM